MIIVGLFLFLLSCNSNTSSLPELSIERNLDLKQDTLVSDVLGFIEWEEGFLDTSSTVIWTITSGDKLGIFTSIPEYSVDVFWEGKRVAWAVEDSVTQERIWTIVDTVLTIRAIREAYLLTLLGGPRIEI